jgi:hypothetical protein
MEKRPSLGVCITLWKKQASQELLSFPLAVAGTTAKTVKELLTTAAQATQTKALLVAMKCTTGLYHSDMVAAVGKLGFKGLTGLEDLVAAETAVDASREPANSDDSDGATIEDLRQADEEASVRRGRTSAMAAIPAEDEVTANGHLRGDQVLEAAHAPSASLPRQTDADQPHQINSVGQPAPDLLVPGPGLARGHVGQDHGSPSPATQGRGDFDGSAAYVALMKTIQDMKTDNDARMDILLSMITTQAEQIKSRHPPESTSKRRGDEYEDPRQRKEPRREDNGGDGGESRRLDAGRSPLNYGIQPPAPVTAPASASGFSADTIEEDYVGKVSIIFCPFSNIFLWRGEEGGWWCKCDCLGAVCPLS